MKDDIIARTTDGIFTVVLEARCRADIVKELQNCKGKESGGILLGKYSEDKKTAHIQLVSSSPPDSSRGRTWFKRGFKGLQKLVDDLWTKRQGYYLGEWHLHPGASPAPSSYDKTEMDRLAKNPDYKCPEPILVILGGTVTDHIFSFHVTNDGVLTQLTCQSGV